MKKVFIVHGFGGEPNGGWRPYLMGKLAKIDIWAFALAMPKPEDPKKDEWVSELSRQIGEPNKEIFLVGHSLGVPTILNYLQTLTIGNKIGGAVLVSGPVHVLSQEERYRKIDHFMDKDFDFNKIKDVCKNFIVIHGDNDKNVPFEQAIELSNNLNCELIKISNGEHLNGSSGWYELPEAFDALLKIME